MSTKFCSEEQPLSIKNITWALTGLVFTLHEVLMETVVFLGILISSVVILSAAFDIERTQDGDELGLATQPDLFDMTQLTEEISNAIGEVLLGYLMYNAITTPKLIRKVFLNGIIVFVSGMINNGPVLVGLLIASVASKRVNPDECHTIIYAEYLT